MKIEIGQIYWYYGDLTFIKRITRNSQNETEILFSICPIVFLIGDTIEELSESFFLYTGFKLEENQIEELELKSRSYDTR